MSGEMQGQLASRASGTTVLGIRQSELRKVALTLPSLVEQETIATVLGALDDKIEQNRRTGQELEGLARTTFKAWFVDFEPVKAKAAGAAGFPGMPHGAFAALPNCLTHSPLGPVPQAWLVGTMGDVGEQRRDQVAPGDVDGEMPYIGLEHMPRRDIALSEWGAAASVTSSKFRFRRGDVLFGKLRPYFHKVGPAPLDGVCSTDIVVIYPKQPEYAAWLVMFVSGDDFVAHTDRSSAGTKMPRTNWKDMAAFAATVPSPALALVFQEWAGPMLDLIAASIHESRKLAALRDYLLPQLLSGRVRGRPSQAEVNG
jgi:type I restriction enzyme S subunit